MVRPPQQPMRRGRVNEISTFGYQFTIAGVQRGRPDLPLVLYESPVYRTATMRPLSKMGRAPRSKAVGPSIGGVAVSPGVPRATQDPSTLVPAWQEQYACATVSKTFDFDLEPGTYDLYIAFDILNREGGWVHRSSGYLTDVTVGAAHRTRVDGVIGTGPGGEREVELSGATLLSERVSDGAGGP
ncbi:MAG TPA: hypothetical protein VFT43_13800 [Candidatus Polarisedimenticolia bacterium]|nr:hypothetical protein [Candidatus Polarisedimenticolia bacterium]